MLYGRSTSLTLRRFNTTDARRALLNHWRDEAFVRLWDAVRVSFVKPSTRAHILEDRAREEGHSPLIRLAESSNESVRHEARLALMRGAGNAYSFAVTANHTLFTTLEQRDALRVLVKMWNQRCTGLVLVVVESGLSIRDHRDDQLVIRLWQGEVERAWEKELDARSGGGNVVDLQTRVQFFQERGDRLLELMIGVPSWRWSEEMARVAQEAANTLARRHWLRSLVPIRDGVRSFRAELAALIQWDRGELE